MDILGDHLSSLYPFLLSTIFDILHNPLLAINHIYHILLMDYLMHIDKNLLQSLEFQLDQSLDIFLY